MSKYKKNKYKKSEYYDGVEPNGTLIIFPIVIIITIALLSLI